MHFARSLAVNRRRLPTRSCTSRGVRSSLRTADVREQVGRYRHSMRLARPRPWEILIAVAAAAALVAEAVNRGSGSAGVAVAIALALIACLPLAWSRQAPLTALLATTAGLLVCLAVFQPYDTAIVVLAVALYQVASLGDRRRS